MTSTEQPKLNLLTGSGPFIHSGVTANKIALYISISIFPLLIWESIRNGIVFALNCALSIIGAWAIDTAFRLVRRKRVKVDFHVLLYGLVLSFLMPLKTHWWLVLAGGGGTILFGKVVFGSLGRNPVNPILASACIFPLLSWYVRITFEKGTYNWTDFINQFARIPVSDPDIFALIAIVVPIVIVSLRKPFDSKLILTFLTIWVVAGALLQFSIKESFPIEITSPLPGILLIVLILSLDKMSIPVTKSGRVIFGMLAAVGIIVGFPFGSGGEKIYDASLYGASYNSIYSLTVLNTVPLLIVNLLTPLIDRFTRPRRETA